MTMINMKELKQVTYEKKNGKLLIHDQPQILESANDAYEVTGMIKRLPTIPQLPNIKINLDKVISHNFGHVYLARVYPNDQVEILYSAPLFVEFKNQNIDGQDSYGYEIPASVNLSAKLKKSHANSLVWIPEIEVKINE